MYIEKAHLYFEQSGTWKRAFIENDIEALDYDILNNFNQTDVCIDLFNEIEKAYAGGAASLMKSQKMISLLPFSLVYGSRHVSQQ